jgi:Uma2 family endonuclease
MAFVWLDKIGGRSMSMTVQIVRHPFTVTDYARMLSTGILSEEDRVELIDGEVRVMSPIGPLHAAIVKRLNTLLGRSLPDTVIVSVQDPIQLNDYSEPQPDLAILQHRDDFYAQAHPVADDVLLVIEVSDTSVEYDRDEKLPRYANANIAEAWLIDVNNVTVEQYLQPRNGKYLVKKLLERGDTLTSVSIAALHLEIERIFE